MHRFYGLLLSLAFMAHGGCSFGQSVAQPGTLRLEVEPEHALFDRPLQIRLYNCPPGERITVRASAVDGKGEVWSSKAMFAPGKSTMLDIGQALSLDGTYRGIDALGLYWSMAPEHRGARFSLATNFIITLEAESSGHVVGRIAAERLIPEHAGVRSHRVRTNGLVGDLYLPATKERVPGLIVLGGSDGEPMKERSGLLAAHGYAVLNLFYFGQDSLPKDLAKIPVEYLTNALSWLQARELVDPRRIGLIGFSRGAEAALLTATLCSDVRVVVAVAPSSVVWPGPGASGYFHSAWLKNGEELPCVPVRFSRGLGPFLQEVTGGTQIEHRPLFEDALKNKRAAEKARIPVERIKGAVLLISGKDDCVWPSALMAEMVIARLRESRHAFAYRHLSYDNAGHSFGLPYLPAEDSSTKVFKLGGTPSGNAIAAVKSWEATLQFMESELRKRAGTNN